MPEIVPQITYSPEGRLSILSVPSDTMNAEWTAKQDEWLDELDQRWGVKVNDSEALSLTIDVQNSLGAYLDARNGDNRRELAEFLGTLSHFLPFDADGTVDRVVGLDWLSERGAEGAVYHQFQRWLNARGLEEDVARRTVEAMAVPFGEEDIQRANRDFSYLSGNLASGWVFEVALTKNDRFTLSTLEETDESFIERRGEVAWSWVDLRTLGDCACWGVAGDDRSRIRPRSNSTKLYDMTPHNIDFAHQSFSLVLGIGALAHEAAQYDGQEDVFSNVNWTIERSFDKDSAGATLIRHNNKLV